MRLPNFYFFRIALELILEASDFSRALFAGSSSQ
jgi:hypothetical protein